MKNLLIVKPSSLGDVLHAFPAVCRIVEKWQKEFPGKEILVDWVIAPAFMELLDFLPFMGEKILFDRKKLGNLKTLPGELLSLARALRKRGRYDAVYDLQGLLRSSLIARMAPSPHHYGSRMPREKLAGLFYSAKLDPGKKNTHAVEKLLHMVSGEEERREIFARREDFILPPNETFRKRALGKAAEAGIPHLEELARTKKVFSISPGARWVSKEWSGKFFAECCLLLKKDYPDAVFLILGTPQEKEKAREIRELLGDKVLSCDLCGKTTIGELTELIRLSSLLLCNDSGPMHIAAFCSTPIAAMFGPTDPVLTGPWCRNKKVLQGNLPCQPCFKRECPRHLECQAAISPQAVADSVKGLLAAADLEP